MQAMPERMVWLAFDVGSRDLGVAVGNGLTGRARPLRTLSMQPEAACWSQLEALIAEWMPEGCVVGLPLSEDGGEQAMSARARDFALQLGQRSGLPIHLQDERGSTQAARRRFAQDRAQGQARRKHAANLDAHAAAVILEDYLATAGP